MHSMPSALNSAFARAWIIFSARCFGGRICRLGKHSWVKSNTTSRKRYGEAVKRAARAGLIFKTFAGPEVIEEGLQTLSAVAAQSWKTEGRGRSSHRSLYAGKQSLLPRHCAAMPMWGPCL